MNWDCYVCKKDIKWYQRKETVLTLTPIAGTQPINMRIEKRMKHKHCKAPEGIVEAHKVAFGSKFRVEEDKFVAATQ